MTKKGMLNSKNNYLIFTLMKLAACTCCKSRLHQLLKLMFSLIPLHMHFLPKVHHKYNKLKSHLL